MSRRIVTYTRLRDFEFDGPRNFKKFDDAIKSAGVGDLKFTEERIANLGMHISDCAHHCIHRANFFKGFVVLVFQGKYLVITPTSTVAQVEEQFEKKLDE